MNQSTKLGIGVAGGYLLGRRRKMKLALGLGAYLMGKKLNLSPAALAKQGIGSLGGLREMPEVAELTEVVRGDLMQAGRRAAMTAMSGRVDALSESLRKRSDGFEGGEKSQDEAYPEERDEGSGGRRTAKRGSTRSRRDEDAGERDDVDDARDEDEDRDEPLDDEPDDARDERDDDVDDEPDDEPDDVRDEDDIDDDDERDADDTETGGGSDRRRSGRRAAASR